MIRIFLLPLSTAVFEHLAKTNPELAGASNHVQQDLIKDQRTRVKYSVLNVKTSLARMHKTSLARRHKSLPPSNRKLLLLLRKK